MRNILYTCVLIPTTRDVLYISIHITRNTLYMAIQYSATFLTILKRNLAEFYEGFVIVIF